MKIIPVILSGGSGSRLWPLSRKTLPKQLLPLVSKKTMLQETILRLKDCLDIERPIIICGHDHRFIVAEQLRDIKIKARLIILEPEGRNTAPAIATAALSLKKKNYSLLVLPADHIIKDKNSFIKSIQVAQSLSEKNKLVTFGIKPDNPDVGYGYIHLGKSLSKNQNSFEISRFVEKPNLSLAKKYLDSGEYLWNSGMFMFKAKVYLDELKKFEPLIFKQSKLSLDKSYNDLDFLRLEENEFKLCPSNSIDYALMEKTKLGVIVKTDIGWSDIGSWSSLSSILKNDVNNNVLRGDTFTLNTKNSFIRSESRFVAALGVEDLIIVDTADALLVCNKKNAQDVKKIVKYIYTKGRNEHELHKKVFRPWGHYESLIKSDNFQVKSIIIKPGAQLSLQVHSKRAEHWVVVSGTANVTIEDKELVLSENQSTYIPIGSKHRLKNAEKTILHIIEIQSGSYLEEDDIVRFDDIYGRN